jgi:hypothetical protein
MRKKPSKSHPWKQMRELPPKIPPGAEKRRRFVNTRGSRRTNRAI